MMSCSLMDSNEFGVINKAAMKVKESDDTNTIGGDDDDGDGDGDGDSVHHHDNHHRPSPFSYQIGGCDGSSGGGGPTCCDHSGSHVNNTIGDVSFTGLKTLPPFEFATATQSAFESPATMGFPFTNAQWKELERQALIYKYMVASVPVPHDLLFPFTRRNSSSAAAAAAAPPPPPVGVATAGFNLLRFSKGGDAEPWRCRRTDGKKWRCSRDVAPDHKYCERHLNRGRPRSRKHVELAPNSNKKTRNQHYTSTNSTTSLSQFVGNFTQYPPLKEQRCLDWMMKRGADAVHLPSSAGQEWNCLINSSSAIINQNYVEEEPLILNSFASFSAGEDQRSNDCSLFINPDLVPRGFIDAWSSGVSNDDRNANSGTKTSVSSGGNLSLSLLSLSMGGSNTIDEDMGQLQMGLGLVESSQEHECGIKLPISSWLHQVSTPGGPLAEVLGPSRVPASGPQSPAARNGDSDSLPETAVSSPSGVHPKKIASWSDSSGNSSPVPSSSRTNKY